MEIVYIAGKITGDPNYFQKFRDAEVTMENEGFLVLNPATLPEGMKPEEYMKICFAMIDVADHVVMLRDWKESAGAKVEKAYCDYIKKSVLFAG